MAKQGGTLIRFCQWLVPGGGEVGFAFQVFGFVRQMATLIVGIVLARSLSLADVGVFEFWMFLLLIFALLVVSGPLQYLVVYYRELSDHERTIWSVAVYLILIVGGTLVALLAMAVATLSAGSHALISATIARWPWVVALMMLQASAYYIPHLLLVRGATNALTRYSATYLVGTVMTVVVALYMSANLDSLLLALIAWAFIQHIYLWRLLWADRRVEMLSKTVFSILVGSLPLTVYAASGLLAYIIDAWLVGIYYPEPEIFGVYRYGARELPGLGAIAAAFATAMVSRFTGQWNDDLPALKRGTGRLIHVFLPLAIVLTLSSEWLFEYFYGVGFVHGAIVFQTYLLVTISRCMFPQVLMLVRRENSLLLGISLLELGLNVAISLALVNSLGLRGIALGTAIAFLAEKLMMFVLVKRIFGVSVSDLMPWRTAMIYSLVLIIIYVLLWIKVI